ncbi:MAG: flagellar motor switch protein FliM [Candidatus Cloacimonadota bacterium]|nr:flagellar motor switch protein FliM [Candidatus Cloacimonadota bacterium]
MKKILSQDEIDALLVDSADEEETEIDLDVLEKKSKKIAKKKIRRYDFKHPELLYKAQFRILKFIHDTFAKSFSANLSASLRTIVDLETLSVDQVRYNEYMSAFDESTCLYTITSPVMGDALVEINSRFVQLIVDRVFGGTGEGNFYERSTTTIEQKTMRKIIFQLINNLNISWRNVVDVNYQYKGFETSPQLVQLTHPNEITIVHFFGMEFAGTKYTMNICYPYYAMESIIKGISTQKIRVKSVSEEESKKIKSTLYNSKIDFLAKIKPVNITIGDFMQLKNGDLIVTDHEVKDELPIFIGKFPKYFGRLIKHGKRKAVQLTRIYEEGGY